MAIVIQQILAAKRVNSASFVAKAPLINTFMTVSALIGMLSLTACQTAPTVIKAASEQTLLTDIKRPTTSQLPTQQPVTQPSKPVTQTPIVKSSPSENSDYKADDDKNTTEPYTPPTQESIVTAPDTIILTPSREDYIISEPSIPSHNELLERARQNSQQRGQQSTPNNSNLPAFRTLMQSGTAQLKAGNLNGAESSFTRAQRLAPKSSAVYFYLAQVALKKNQPRKAEAMARRGLTISQDSNRRRALWQLILQSGQAQGNARVIKEARQALH